MKTATAIAHPNIALCKYWGKREETLNLPAVPSLSLTIAPFRTRTTVTWGVEADEVALNGAPAGGLPARKVLLALDRVDPWRPPCKVASENNFPTAAGLASSSSGFAALTLAAVAASGQQRTLEALSVLARRGSGSACRSLFGGWVEWRMGERPDGADCHAFEIFPPEHWAVAMVVAVVGSGPKEDSSTDGMRHTRATSPYYDAWCQTAPLDIAPAREAIAARDLEALGRVMERSTLRMHATMYAADPGLGYWRPGTVAAMEVVKELRRRGVSAWFTIDAGPNVKVLCEERYQERVAEALGAVAERVVVLRPGPSAFLE